MISRGVRISIAEGGEEMLRAYISHSFFFLFFCYHVFIVKVQKTARSVSYGENKTNK